VYPSDKLSKKIVVDQIKTADIDVTNNTWPKKINQNLINYF
jgi:hypothetical protein